MTILAKSLVFLIAVLHLYIMFFEMFLWTSRGPKLFSNFPRDLFEPTKAMAANQGLYNGFLAAGLLWSLLISNPEWQQNVAICFLVFVFIAGVYGSFTVSRRIIYVQSVPALLGLVVILAFN